MVIVVLVALAGAMLGFEMTHPTSLHGCYAQTFGVEMMTFNNRTYCGETIDVQPPPTQCPPSTGPTTTVGFWNFTFGLETKGECESGALAVTVTEPNGTTFQGGPYFGTVVGFFWTTWFTPDQEAGVYEPSYLANVTLLVEVGA
jgi:hypothetical protein